MTVAVSQMPRTSSRIPSSRPVKGEVATWKYSIVVKLFFSPGHNSSV